MRGPPSLYTAEIAERILKGLSAGRSLNAVCRDEGTVRPSTVAGWARKDHDGFAARYQNAREVGHGSMRLYTDALAERILGELKRGQTLHTVCRQTGMPSANTVRQGVKIDYQGFGVRYAQASTIGRPLVIGPSLYTPQLAERLLEELCNGRSLTDVCDDPGMPSIGTVMHWAASNREGFRMRYLEARQIGWLMQADKILDISDDSRNDWVERRNKDGSSETVFDADHLNRSRLRCEQRRWLLSKILPRLNLYAQDDDGDNWSELMKLVKNKTRGLPKKDDETE